MARLDSKHTKQNVGAQQAKVFVRAKPEATPNIDGEPAVSTTSASGATSATEDAVVAGTAKQRRIVLGDVAQKQGGARNAGAVTAQHGVGFFDRVAYALKKSVTVALVGVAMIALPNAVKDASADTVFLDHNNATMEITVARQLAQEVREKFFLVRPDTASVEQIFAQAERGEINLRHLILSGHSGGTSFSGTGADGTRYETSFTQYKELKAKYPRAFAQVKHVHFLACYAGSMSNSAQWKTIFENAVTIGFHAIAPSKDRPASTQVLANVERYVRQNVDGKRLSPAEQAMHARNITRLQGPNITNFAVRVGDAYASVGEKITNIDTARDRVNLLRMRHFDPYFNPVGQAAQFADPPLSSRPSDLQTYYRELQAFRNAVPPDSHEHSTVQLQSEQTLRLFHWQQVLRNAQATHGQTFVDAQSELASLGITDVRIPSDLSILTRLQIVELANKLEALGNIATTGLATMHAHDLDVVNTWLAAKNEKLELPTPGDGAYKTDWARTSLQGVIADEVAPNEVKIAAASMMASLGRTTPLLDKAREVIVKGLRDLQPTVIPQSWID